MKSIQEAIRQSEYTENDLKNNCIGIRLMVDEGSFYMHTKSELLHLLSLVTKKQLEKAQKHFNNKHGGHCDSGNIILSTPLITRYIKQILDE